MTPGNIGKRLHALESTVRHGLRKVHLIIQHIGKTEDEAYDAYGRHLIHPDDDIVLRFIIIPRGEAADAR